MRPSSVMLLLLMVGTGLLPAQARRTTKTGTTAAQFLKIGVHARVLGMGEASVAHAPDISAIQWNPAGLARHNVQEVVFSQMPWFADTDLLHFAAALNLGNAGVLGVQATVLDYGEEDVTTERAEMGTGERYSAQDLTLGLAYARNLTTNFSLGGQFKLVSQRIWNMRASTTAIDLGALFITPFRGIRFGMAITNFGGKLQLQGRDTRFFYDPYELMEGNNDQIPANYELGYWAIPLTFRVGLAGELISSQQLRLSLAVDALHPSDNAEYINVGTELGLMNRIFLRAGFRTLYVVDQVGGLSLGAGLDHAFSPNLRVKIDYAWMDYGILLTHSMLSLTVVY